MREELSIKLLGAARRIERAGKEGRTLTKATVRRARADRADGMGRRSSQEPI